MQFKVVDAVGISQTVVAKGVEALVNKSSTITTTALSQVVIPENPLRSGFIIQNISGRVMWVNDLGDAVAGASFQIAAGAFFPPAGYPVSTGSVNILGTATDAFTAREW